MPRIIYIKDVKDKKLITLGIEHEGVSVRYFINYALYVKLGRPVKNEDISSRAVDEIKYCDELYRARKKALGYLALADNNSRELALKLKRAGFCRDVADEVTREMVELGYINEARQLERLITREAQTKLSGPRKICARLAAKGYALSDIKTAMRALTESGELDFDAVKEELLIRKLADPSDTEEKKKILYKYGF